MCTTICNTFEEIEAFQDLFYSSWRTKKPKLLFSTALAGEIGEVCSTVTHLEGGGTNRKKYDKKQVLHQCVDSYVQLVLLLARYGFSADDFEAEFWHVMKEELPKRLEEKLSVVSICTEKSP